ncbi:hypothetical protein CTAYLR_002872 [Chrysophaeum taylorii]|uniref:Glutamine amidotransferase type-2 domain-containing protein n=1 Tax=Chrysophaeum taylorii TaxID=2483200 RepID=A0AAD7U7Y5_9STRA|nr:hypothetical protein CTAYLR_002872 [Chrysophaeum taylorii]
MVPPTWVLLVVPAVACRFVVYVGDEEMSAEELLVVPDHNIIGLGTADAEEHTPGARSSGRFNASQFACRNVDKNLDGWGVSWYVEGSDFPRRIRSPEAVAIDGRPHGELLKLIKGDPIIPFMATNNSCVSDVVPERRFPLRSKAILAHVRAASAGGLDKTNSHPFVYNTLTWVHNGAIAAFDEVKRRLRATLDPSILGLVAGDTDSEYAGAVFVDQLKGFPQGPSYSVDQLKAAMRTTLKHITELNEEFDDGNSLNFGVSDGKNLVVARYRSCPNEDPPTLYYKLARNGVVVASEPLDTDPHHLLDWTLLGKDRFLSYGPSVGVVVECIDPLTCDPCDTPAAAFHQGRLVVSK